MMAKAPDQRFQTPDEVAKALTPFYKKASKTAVAPGLGIAQSRPASSPSVADQTQVASACPPASAPAEPTVAARQQDRPEVMWQSLLDISDPEDIEPAWPTRPSLGEGVPANSGQPRPAWWQSQRPALHGAALSSRHRQGRARHRGR